MTTYLIKGAAILGGEPTDLLLRDGTIAEIGADLAADGAEVIDATGLVALPGLVDLHTHLREPGREDAETVETGTQAAALGGFTAVHAMANTDPVADTAGVVEQVWRLGREAGYCDVYPVGAVTVGLAGERLAELGAMADSAARVRVFSDDGKCVSDPVLMRRALEYVKAFDGVVAQHAQEPRLTEDAQMNEGELSGRLGLRGWPAVAEEAIIARDCLLAAHVGSRLHVCHVSTAGSVEIVRWAKAKGWDVTAEVCPHHLLLTDELAATYDPIYKVNPPLRTAADVEALRAGLADGTIDIVATDHAPHPHEDKDCEWQAAAFGMLGLETALSDRPGDDGRHRPDRLGRRRRADVRHARRGSAGSPRTAARSPRASRPTSSSTTRPSRRVVDSAEVASLSREHAVRRDGAARPGGRHVPARHAPRSSTGSWHDRRPRVLVLEDGRVFHGDAVRRDRRDVRRGGVLHRDDRLPGDAHRPVVPPPGRGDDRPARRQHRHERRGPGVAQDLGQRVRRPRPRPGPLQLALGPHASTTSSASRAWSASRGIDTRALTRHLRERGAMRVGISSTETDADALLARVRDAAEMAGAELAGEVSTTEAYVVPAVGEKRFTVAAVDLGIKANTPRMMAERGIEVHVLPATSTLEDVLAVAARRAVLLQRPRRPGGHHRPGRAAQGRAGRRGCPYFGICFGNQLFGRALGFGTYKLKYGHRGINQPVMDRTTGKVEVTAHNHGFAVDAPLDAADRRRRTASRRSATSASTTTWSRDSSCARRTAT